MSFFSCCSCGDGKFYYFDNEQRKNILIKNPDDYKDICFHYNLNERRINAYDYNPLTRKFYAYPFNSADDDSKKARLFCESTWPKAVPQLIVKDIINPTHVVKKSDTLTRKELQWFDRWLMMDFAHAKRAGILRDIKSRFGDYIGDYNHGTFSGPIRFEVDLDITRPIESWFKNSFGFSKWLDVINDVEDSTNCVINAYISTFFDIPRKYNLSACVNLWNNGLIPVFDGETWRLFRYSNKTVIVVHEMANTTNYSDSSLELIDQRSEYV